MVSKVLIPQPYYPNGDYDLWIRLSTPSGANLTPHGEARFHQASPSQLEMTKGCTLVSRTSAVYTELQIYSGMGDTHPWVFVIAPTLTNKGDLIEVSPTQSVLPGITVVSPTGITIRTSIVKAHSAEPSEVAIPSGVPSCIKCGKPNEYQVHGYTCWSCSNP